MIPVLIAAFILIAATAAIIFIISAVINLTELPIISEDRLKEAEQVLVQNGIEPDMAASILGEIGYILLNTDLYFYEKI